MCNVQSLYVTLNGKCMGHQNRLTKMQISRWASLPRIFASVEILLQVPPTPPHWILSSYRPTWLQSKIAEAWKITQAKITTFTVYHFIKTQTIQMINPNPTTYRCSPQLLSNFRQPSAVNTPLPGIPSNHQSVTWLNEHSILTLLCKQLNYQQFLLSNQSN